MATYTVKANPIEANEFATIQAAIDAAAGAAGADLIIIDASYVAVESATVTESGLTFQGNSAATGITLTLAAGIGTVTLTGTTPINVVGNASSNSIIGNSGSNIFTLQGAGFDMVDGGTGGSDRLVANFDDGNGIRTRLGVNDSEGLGGDAAGYSGVLQSQGFVSYIRFSGIESFSFTNVAAGGADLIITGDGDDLVSTGGGNDIINSGRGVDTIDGGAGIDLWQADKSAALASEAIVLDLTLQATQFYTVGGVTGSVTGIEGVSLTTGAGNDRITTSSSLLNDVISTGSGDDIITVQGAGFDSVDGGTGGSDRLVANFDDGNGIRTRLGVNGSETLGGDAAGYSGVLQSQGFVSYVQFSGIESFSFTNVAAGGADRIITGDGNDFVSTGGGNDTIISGGGVDTIDGGSGLDFWQTDKSAALASEAIILDLTLQATQFYTIGGVTGSVTGIEGINLTTGAGNDRITTTSVGFGDVISTGSGDDIITVQGAGDDTVDGGAGGSDRLIMNFNDGNGVRTRVGFNVGEGIGGSASGYSGVFQSQNASDNVRFSNIESFSFTNVSAGGADRIVTGDGDDFVSTGGGDDTIISGGGNDTLDGGAGADSIDGGAGIDTLTYAGSSAGVTVNLRTGAGSGGDAQGDVIVAEGTNNSSVENLIGSASADTFTGDVANNSIDGGAGIDTVAFIGNFADYTITLAAANPGGLATLRFVDTLGRDGTDTVANTEFYRFADGTRSYADLVNDAPTITLASPTLAVTEDVLSVINGITFADIDAQGEVVIVNLSVSGGRLFAPNNYPGVGIAGNGTDVLTLFGTTVDLNLILAANEVSYRTAPNANGEVTLTVTINDQGRTGIDPGATGTATDESATAVVTLQITPVNDAPAGGTPTRTILEDATYTFATGDFGFTDPNDAAAPNALLAVRISTVPTGGTLLLDADGSGPGAPVAVTAGQSVSATDIAAGRLTFVPALNSNGTAASSFTFQVQDNGGTSPGIDLDQSQNSFTFNVTPVNDAPAVTAGSLDGTVTLPEDGPATALFTAAPTIEDVDSATITATLTVANPSAGTLTGTGVSGGTGGVYTITGSASGVTTALAGVQFTPTANFNGGTSVSVAISDGGDPAMSQGVPYPGGSVSVSVTPVNDAPAGADATLTLLEDGTRSFTASDFGFTDPLDSPSNGLAAVVITTLPTSGTLALNGTAITVAGTAVAVGDLPNLTYTPGLNGNGTGYASFTFQVRDDGTGPGVSTDGSPDTITFNVTPVNDAPVVTTGSLDGTVTLAEDGPATALFAAAPTIEDVDSATITATLTVANPSAGTLTGTGVSGGTGGVYTITGSASGVTTALAGVQFTPTANFNGGTSVSVAISDGGDPATSQGSPYPSGSVSVSVTPVNDAPAGADATLTLLEDGTRSFTASDFGFTDPLDSPSNGLAAVVITTLPTSGTLALNGTAITVAGTAVAVGDLPNLTYTPGLNGNGTGYASFTFQVRDDGTGPGVETDGSPDTITFNVTPVNDAPAVTGAGTDPTFTENGSAVSLFSGVTISTVEAGQAIDQAVFTVTNVEPGDVLGTATGSIPLTDGTVAGDPATVGQLSVTVVDGTATVTFSRVGGISSAQAAAYINALDFSSTSENPSGAARTVTLVSLRDNGGRADGGDDDVAPNIASVVTVTPVNDAPVATGLSQSLTVAEDAPPPLLFTTAPVVSDVDSANVTATLTLSNTAAGALVGAGPASGGVYTIAGTPAAVNAALAAVTFAPAGDFNGTASVAVAISDGQNGPQGGPNPTGTVLITVTEVNDVPVPVADTLAGRTEDAAVFTIAGSALTGNDGRGGGADETGQTLTVTGVANVVGGVATVSGGDVSFTLDPNFDGTASFDYTVQDNGTTDGSAAPLSATGRASFAVGPVNDAPSAVDDTGYSVVSGTVLTIPAGAGVLVNDTDIDTAQSALTVDLTTIDPTASGGSATAATAHGSVTVNRDGSFTFTPAAGYVGPDSFTYRVFDGQLASANTARVSITVMDMPAADTVAPGAPLVAVAQDTGTDATDRLTRDPTITATPSAEGDTLRYQIDGGAPSTTAPLFARDGTADGRHTVSVTEMDADGNVSPAASISFTLDSVAPTLRADAISATGLSGPLTGNVLANDSDASPLHLGSVQLSGSPAVTVPASGTAQIVGAHGTLTIAADGGFAFQPMSAGQDVFTETVVDAAGNASQTTLTFDVEHAQETAFRFFDTATGGHLFTTNALEAAQIRANPGFAQEGTPWTTPDTGTDTVDVFRFFDTRTGDRFYTADVGERDGLVTGASGYTYEGVAFQAYADAGASGTTTLERFFNTQTGQHMYAFGDEAAGIQHGSAGANWVDEGKAFVVHVADYGLMT